MPAALTKWSQFLTKSIITAEPKVKCSVVPAGWATADSAARAGALRSRAELLEARSSHAGSPCTSPDTDVGGGFVVGFIEVAGVSAIAADTIALVDAAGACPAAAAAAACMLAWSCLESARLA